MAKYIRSSRKVSDADLVRRNSIGLSLGTIADELGCHPSTITLRLRALSIAPADTRRCFMDDVFKTLSPVQQEWLADQLGPHYSIKDFIRNLMVEKFVNGQPASTKTGQV